LQSPKYTKGQLQSFALLAPISLFHQNQTLSAGVAHDKNNKDVCIFHEYFEYIFWAAHLVVINISMT
jgi:hypothetical protein